MGCDDADLPGIGLSTYTELASYGQQPRIAAGSRLAAILGGARLDVPTAHRLIRALVEAASRRRGSLPGGRAAGAAQPLHSRS